MSKSNYLENELLKYIFNNVTTGFNSDAAYYFALHTADPGEAGAGNTNEVAYTGYARVLVSRNAGGFTVSGSTVSNTSMVMFPACTDNLGGTPVATHYSITRAASGASEILYKAALTSSLAISQNITPIIAASAAQITED